MFLYITLYNIKSFCRAPDITAVGTIFNILGYDAVLDPSSTRQRVDALRATQQSQVLELKEPFLLDLRSVKFY